MTCDLNYISLYKKKINYYNYTRGTHEYNYHFL